MRAVVYRLFMTILWTSIAAGVAVGAHSTERRVSAVLFIVVAVLSGIGLGILAERNLWSKKGAA